MNEVCFSAYAHGTIHSESRHRAYAHATGWLSLAAAPTFAIMALLTSLNGVGPDMLGSITSDAWPLGGMVPMYLLMTVFHTGPWLKLFSAWRTRFHVESFLRRER